MLWNFTLWLSWLRLVFANTQGWVCVYGYTHSSPHSFFWLSCVQWQLFAAFTLLLLLEVKSLTFLLAAHWAASPQAGDILADAEKPWPGLYYPEVTSILEEHKVSARMLEGGLDFLGCELIYAVSTKYISDGWCSCIVFRQSVVNIMYVFFRPLRFPSHVSLLQSAISAQPLECLIPSWYTWS